MESTMFKIYTDEKHRRLLNIQIISEDYPDIINITDIFSTSFKYDIEPIYDKIIKNNQRFYNGRYIDIKIAQDPNMININISEDNTISVVYSSAQKIVLSEELSNEIVNKTVMIADLLINDKERIYNSDEIIEF